MALALPDHPDKPRSKVTIFHANWQTVRILCSTIHQSSQWGFDACVTVAHSLKDELSETKQRLTLKSFHRRKFTNCPILFNFKKPEALNFFPPQILNFLDNGTFSKTAPATRKVFHAWVPLHMKCYSLANGAKTVRIQSLTSEWYWSWSIWRVFAFFGCGPLQIKKTPKQPHSAVQWRHVVTLRTHQVLRLRWRSGQILNPRIVGDIQELASANMKRWLVLSWSAFVLKSTTFPAPAISLTISTSTSQVLLATAGCIFGL